jgi:hypothetical protein
MEAFELTATVKQIQPKPDTICYKHNSYGIACKGRHGVSDDRR